LSSRAFDEVFLLVRYIDAGKWPEAIRLTTQHFPEEVPHVLMSYATLLADAGRLQEAEAQMVSSNRPELAIKMYKVRSLQSKSAIGQLSSLI
jgi:uncharacterized protein YeaC (DUF1315 family)